MEDRQWFILYVLVCLEVGIFLTLVPWSGIWERNYFLEAYPGLRPILLAPWLRGAVAGLGVANVYLGLSEIVSRRRRALGQVASEPEDYVYGRDGSGGSAPETRPTSKTLRASEERR